MMITKITKNYEYNDDHEFMMIAVMPRGTWEFWTNLVWAPIPSFPFSPFQSTRHFPPILSIFIPLQTEHFVT